METLTTRVMKSSRAMTTHRSAYCTANGMSTTGDSFTCADCGQTFQTDYLDETLGLQFGRPGTELVCDECYQLRLYWLQQERPSSIK